MPVFMTEDRLDESLRAVERDGRWCLEGGGLDGVGLVNDYLGYLADRGYSPRTVRVYVFVLLAFCRWLVGEEVGLGEVSTELASVIWAVQMSTVEFHPWNSRRADTERPDEWRIDLDPMPECGFETVRRVAHVAHGVLDELGAVGWPKTSGGSGLHVYVRIEARWGFADVRRAALAFAREVERRAPDDVTTTWWRKDRDPRKLFVDYNQNTRDHTIASAYSVRGVPEGTVSTPITWDEIDDVQPKDCTIATVPRRFAELGDLHEHIDDAAFSLATLLEWAERDERDGAADPGGSES